MSHKRCQSYKSVLEKDKPCPRFVIKGSCYCHYHIRNPHKYVTELPVTMDAFDQCDDFLLDVICRYLYDTMAYHSLAQLSQTNHRLHDKSRALLDSIKFIFFPKKDKPNNLSRDYISDVHQLPPTNAPLKEIVARIYQIGNTDIFMHQYCRGLCFRLHGSYKRKAFEVSNYGKSIIITVTQGFDYQGFRTDFMNLINNATPKPFKINNDGHVYEYP